MKPTGSREVRLSELGKHRAGRIVRMEGEDDRVTRLHALGFLPGRVVQHRDTAPLGDPLAFELEGQKVSLRRTEAALVIVQEEGQ